MQGMERAGRIFRLAEFCYDVRTTPDCYSESDKKLVKASALQYLMGKEQWPLDRFRPERDQVKFGDYPRIIEALNFEVAQCNGNKAAAEAVYKRFSRAIAESVRRDTGGAMDIAPSNDVPHENQVRIALKFMEIIGKHAGMTRLLADNLPATLHYADLGVNAWGECVAYQFGPKNGIHLSKKMFSNLETAAAGTRKFIEEGWWVDVSAGEEWRCTVVHETGHAIHNALIYIECNKNEYKYVQNRRKILAKYAREIRRLSKQYAPGQTVGAIKKMMSRYGQSNDAEFFAEAFSNAMGGRPDIIGKGMQDFLRVRGLL